MSPARIQQTALPRREFLGASLAWLAFWRRDRRSLCGIPFRVIHGHSSGRRFLLIHGNESTAREVLAEFVPTAQGTGYLIQNRERNVPLNLGKLDPNRMFSSEGAERNLRTLNPNWADVQIINALLYLDKHRRELIDAVRPRHGDVLIAVHNNSSGYSMNDELDISDRKALNDSANPHEFCLCTDEADFDRLSHGPYNVLLQRRAPQSDDGSLSRLSVNRGFRYVNIEAGLGQKAKQRAMVEWVNATLPAVN